MNYSKPHAWLHRINNTRRLVATQPTFYSSQQPQQPHLNNLIPTLPAYMETPPERASSSLLLVLCPQNCLKTSISKHCQTQLFLVQRITRYRGFGLFDDHLLDSEAKARGAQHLSQLGGVKLDP